MRNGSARPPMEIPPAFFAIRRFRFYGVIYNINDISINWRFFLNYIKL